MDRRAAVEAGLAQVGGLPALGFGLLRMLILRRRRAVRRSSATVRRPTGARSSRAPAARGFLRLRWPPFRRSWSQHLRPQVGAPPRGARAQYMICFGRDALTLCSLVSGASDLDVLLHRTAHRMVRRQFSLDSSWFESTKKALGEALQLTGLSVLLCGARGTHVDELCILWSSIRTSD